MKTASLLKIVASFGVAAVCFGLLSTPRAARAQVLGTASGYNLFTFNDASNANVEIDGKVAVGGNANFSNYTIATRAGLDYTSAYAVVVGGTYSNTFASVQGSVIANTINMVDPTIFGNVQAVTSITTSGFGTIQGNNTAGNQTVTYGTTFTNAPGSATAIIGTTAQGSVTLPIDFAAEKLYLQNLSGQLNGLALSGTNHFLFGNQTSLVGTGSQNVYSVSYTQLANSVGGFNITADAGATVIVNITGGAGGPTFTVPNTGYAVSGTKVEKVLFNFVDATSFNLSSFNASILAPYADIIGSSGGYQGTLIAKSFAGNNNSLVNSGLELHSVDPNNVGQNVLFTGTVTGLGSPQPVPEPGVWVTALSLAGMTGAGMVRGRLRGAKPPRSPA